MQADNWDKGSLLGFRAISFSQELPAYNSIQQPVLVVQGRQDSTILTSSATGVRLHWLTLAISMCATNNPSTAGLCGAAATPSDTAPKTTPCRLWSSSKSALKRSRSMSSWTTVGIFQWRSIQAVSWTSCSSFWLQFPATGRPLPHHQKLWHRSLWLSGTPRRLQLLACPGLKLYETRNDVSHIP